MLLFQLLMGCIFYPVEQLTKFKLMIGSLPQMTIREFSCTFVHNLNNSLVFPKSNMSERVIIFEGIEESLSIQRSISVKQ